MMTPRDFFGDEEYKRMKTHYDELMRFRKTIKGKPNLEQRIQLLCNNEIIDWYKTILFHIEGSAKCDCRRCSLKKQGIDIFDTTPYQLDLFMPFDKFRITFYERLENTIKEWENDQIS